MPNRKLLAGVALPCLLMAWWAWTGFAAPSPQAQPGPRAEKQKNAKAAAAAAERILIEAAMPKQVQTVREDYPALASDGSGGLWAAWLRYEARKDSLRVTRLRAAADGKWEREKEWTLALPGQVAGHPAIAARGGRAWLAAPVETGRAWDLYAWTLGQDGPGEPVAITSDAATDATPAAAVAADGRLWVVWQSNRGGMRGIFASSAAAGGKFTPPERLSLPGASASNPAIVAVGDGVAVAYDSFRDSNSDIWLRVRRGGAWQPERRLTSSFQLDRHPWLASENGRLWVAWEAQEFDVERYRMNAAVMQSVRVARVEPDGLAAPAGMDEERFTKWVSRPSIVFDGLGRLWLALRLSTSQHGSWETLYYCYSGDRWSQLDLPRLQGRIRAVPMALAGGRLAAAQQIDDVSRGAEAPGHPEWWSNLLFPALDPARAPQATPLRLSPYREPAAAEFDVRKARLARGEDGSTRSTRYNGRDLKVYWGDFHEHSNVSVCNRRGNSAPEDLYANLRDIARLDFAGITDHGYNIDEYIWSWNSKNARLHDDPGRFVSFHAQEWTSSFAPPARAGDLKRYGHRNLFYADSFFTRWFNARDLKTPRQVWDELKGVNFITIPHQLADTGNCPTDWNYTEESLQPVAEIYQNRGSYEFLDNPKQPGAAMRDTGHYIQDVWARGTVIGVIASPDHGGGQGKAAVYSERLDRESILDAVRARHTYATTGAKIHLEVRVNGRLMGEKGPAPAPGQPVEVSVRVTGSGALATVEVCRNNQFVYKRQGEGRSLEFVFRDAAPPSGRLWYYVRVIQQDSEMAWSSPVWLGA